MHAPLYVFQGDRNSNEDIGLIVRQLLENTEPSVSKNKKKAFFSTPCLCSQKKMKLKGFGKNNQGLLDSFWNWTCSKQNIRPLIMFSSTTQSDGTPKLKNYKR